MTANGDLDQYLATYANDPFDYENELMLYNYVTRCVNYSSNHENYLELGIGHGITLDISARYFSKVVVLEGFEKFTSSEKFYNIGMGFVLEHVDDPVCILSKVSAQFLRAYLQDALFNPAFVQVHHDICSKVISLGLPTTAHREEMLQ